jgi:hypothetical protein
MHVQLLPIWVVLPDSKPHNARLFRLTTPSAVVLDYFEL